MARTAVDLIRELGKRTGDLVLATPSSGTTTTLVDAKLKNHFPYDIEQFYPWVYGASDVVAGNVGFERRANLWTVATSTLTFPAVWPVAVTSAGTYEVHRRFQRSRILEAINSAVGELQMYWYREFVDESLTTVANQWKYTLPASERWTNITKVHIQSVLDAALVGFPYTDAFEYGWSVYRDVNETTGAEVMHLQFQHQPPSGRLLRVYGEGYFADLSADTDVLAVGTKWERPAMGWIFDYAHYLLACEVEGWASVADSEKVRMIALDRLMRAKERLLEQAPVHKNTELITPMNGDGSLQPVVGGQGRYPGLYKMSWLT